jgi:hypothetical protein
MEVTFDSVAGQTYSILVTGTSPDLVGNFSIQAADYVVNDALVNECFDLIKQTCTTVKCGQWKDCVIVNIRATCETSNTCKKKCKTWWRCARRVSRKKCEAFSAPSAIKKREQILARQQAIDELNTKCDANVG